MGIMTCILGRFASRAKEMGIEIPEVVPEPGMPFTIMSTLSAETGLQEGKGVNSSANIMDNPHWNDQLVYQGSGSVIHYDGMDYFVRNGIETWLEEGPDGKKNVEKKLNHTYLTNTADFKYNFCCFKECGRRQVSKTRLSTTTTWYGADGKQTIKMVHLDPLDPEMIAAKAAPLAACYNFSPIGCIKVCSCLCVSRGEQIYYSKMEPEKFIMYHNDQQVGHVEVLPGWEKDPDDEEERLIIKSSTAYTQSVMEMVGDDKGKKPVFKEQGRPVWVMNDAAVLPDEDGRGKPLPKRCCGSGPSGWDACVPLACPGCIPCCSPSCAICKLPGCAELCGPCRTGCATCGVMCGALCYYYWCCQWCPKCDKPCCKCGILETLSLNSARYMPLDTKQRMHRTIYPLRPVGGQTWPAAQGTKDKKDKNKVPDEFAQGWITYTAFESPGVASRCTLASPFKETAAHPLLSLPLLIDLYFGAEDHHRNAWTIHGSAMFDHDNVVNWWPEPQVLQSVMYQCNLGSLYNDYSNPKNGPAFLDRAPVQQAMNAMDQGLIKVEKIGDKIENLGAKAQNMVEGVIPGVGDKTKKSKSVKKGGKNSEAEPLTVGRES
jgi:hypothetical protein